MRRLEGGNSMRHFRAIMAIPAAWTRAYLPGNSGLKTLVSAGCKLFTAWR